MNDDRPLFILAGNGPYDNRGCEAIVRGTVDILNQHYDRPKFLCISHFNSKEQFERQKMSETDCNIHHLSTNVLNKREVILNWYRPETWKYVHNLLFDKGKLSHRMYSGMLPHLPDAEAVLSVGGDNYSLDYGKPFKFTMLDDLVLRENKPLIIWGASVGPFDKAPEYEVYMSHHLQEVSGIFARESATIEYLKSIGISENVHSVADPAFVMKSIRPAGIEEDLPIDEEMIGFNLSPLMAKYSSNGDLDAWTNMAASIIGNVAQETGMPICLIPHVTNPTSNDYTFMQHALSRIENKDKKITLIQPKYNASETKWIISQMVLFAGARTHSTIAALSSSVPTLSFAYSIKSQGINQDIFGNTDYCLSPHNLDVKKISNRILSMLDDATIIGEELRKKIPRIQEVAMSAGMRLRNITAEM